MSLWAPQGRRIEVQEVGPRDGLQIEPVFVPTAGKVALVDALSLAGLPRIEVSAFVSPRAIPALRDAAEVFAAITRRPGTLYTALVPNARGAEAAMAARADELNTVMSVTETHNLCNLRMTREQSFAGLREVARLAAAAGTPFNASLSCVFGCPMEGEVAVAEALAWSVRLAEELGATGITLADTTGMAHPAQVHALVQACLRRLPQVPLTLHFHNTRGLGFANVLAAIDAGASRFDAALGGLGGCPYAPGATGNVCTEDVVHGLEAMGFDTGVDLLRLLEAARLLPALVGHEVPGQVLRAGRRLDLHRPPADFEAIRERALARG